VWSLPPGHPSPAGDGLAVIWRQQVSENVGEGLVRGVLSGHPSQPLPVICRSPDLH
jgi:hypothetical protein